MWTLLERHLDAAWLATSDRRSQVIRCRSAAESRVEEAALTLAEVGHRRVPVGAFVTLEFGGDRLYLVNFDEGCLVVLPSKNANAMALKAALRRWPGTPEPLDSSFDGLDETARRPANLVGNGGGLEESTRVNESGALEFDSFAEETAMGPRTYRREEMAAKTRIMACTWIQVVEHFGRIDEMVGARFGLEDGSELFRTVSSPLGRYLYVEGGDFQTDLPADRVGSADAEALEAVYQVWITQMEASVARAFAREVPALDARPWRSLLARIDAPMEPIAFTT